MTIDRRAVVERHRIRLTAPDATHALSVGNGDFAFTADVTGLQTFTAFHDPSSSIERAMASGAGLAATLSSEPVLNTTTMSTWGWHEMPNPRGFVLDDAMSEYETPRGPVRYPDRYNLQAAMTGTVSEEDEAGIWLHSNPQRIDLGRFGLELRARIDADVETDPSVLTEVDQQLDLWAGSIDSRYRYEHLPVHVETAAAPDDSVVAFRVTTGLLQDGRARVVIRFPYPSDEFFRTASWTEPDRHHSDLTSDEPGRYRIARTIDDTAYSVTILISNGEIVAAEDPHTFAIETTADVLEVVASFDPEPRMTAVPTFADVTHAAAQSWERFWLSGAAIDLSGSTDERSGELERRIVLSQYLTRVHSSGVIPPQETGLVTNSWQGKFHLEMHLWHAAHFAAWGRPDLLTRSFDWYAETLPVAQATAARQGYPGARWPKQVGPDGRESPSPIGSLLVWQQPHLLYLLELAWHASNDEARADLVSRYAELVEQTAIFMAAFPESQGGRSHLGPPVMPAQEFYDATTTSDPTFELAYWWWGLEIAQRWRERRGLERDASWGSVQQTLAAPTIVDGRYAAVAGSDELRRDDHPSLLAAFGLVPSTPLIEPVTMEATLLDVLDRWDWPTAWGWDFPMLAMTATRLGRTDLAIEALLRPESKNHYSAVGHNPQMGAALPLYLPANGSLLAAVSLLVSEQGTPDPIPGWSIEAEDFPGWPG